MCVDENHFHYLLVWPIKSSQMKFYIILPLSCGPQKFSRAFGRTTSALPERRASANQKRPGGTLCEHATYHSEVGIY